jgi:hypothetical protein
VKVNWLRINSGIEEAKALKRAVEVFPDSGLHFLLVIRSILQENGLVVGGRRFICADKTGQYDGSNELFKGIMRPGINGSWCS